MGCGSSHQSMQTSYQRPGGRAVTYGDHSEPSTTCTSLDPRSEPDGQENDIENAGDGAARDHKQPRPAQKSQAEFWAHPPPCCPSHSCAHKAPGKKAANKGPQPTHLPGHTLHDMTRPIKADSSDRQGIMDSELT